MRRRIREGTEGEQTDKEMSRTNILKEKMDKEGGKEEKRITGRDEEGGKEEKRMTGREVWEVRMRGRDKRNEGM